MFLALTHAEMKEEPGISQIGALEDNHGQDRSLRDSVIMQEHPAADRPLPLAAPDPAGEKPTQKNPFKAPLGRNKTMQQCKKGHPHQERLCMYGTPDNSTWQAYGTL